MKKEYHSFNFLKKIYFVRTGGSDEELKAANLIIEEVNKLGGEAHIEEFEVDASNITKSVLKFSEPDFEIECAGSGYSGFTSDEGVSGEPLYAGIDEEWKDVSLKGKIILKASKRQPHPIYEKAIKDGAAGFILATGDVYRKSKDVDLDPYLTRDLDYNLGKIPTVMVRMADLEKIMEKDPKKATIILQGEDYKRNSRNVVVEIKGTTHPDEIIAFSAHYDSVSYSKGAYDNGTGAITLLQLFHYYMNHKPDRTLKFVWCGSEEMGLLGSKAYVRDHKEEVEKNIVLNINIDMVAVTLGSDIARVTGDNSIVDYIKYTAKEFGFPISVKQGVYSSDSTPFADNGVPSMSFARIAPMGGATIHSHNDVIERLSEPNYIRTCDFIIKLSERWINAKIFPIEKVIPQNVKDDIDKYYQRKTENK